MHFNIRDIVASRSIPRGETANLEAMAGKEFEFKSGITGKILLPSDSTLLNLGSHPLVAFQSLDHWVRFFRYPNGDEDVVHVLGVSQDEETSATIIFRLDFVEPRSRRSRMAVEVKGIQRLSPDECAAWLFELALRVRADADFKRSLVKLAPPAIFPTLPKLVCVAPVSLEGRVLSRRFEALGDVFGASVKQVVSTHFRQVNADLKNLLPFQSAVLCSGLPPFLREDVVPSLLPRSAILASEATGLKEVEADIQTWIEFTAEGLLQPEVDPSQEEEKTILHTMLQGMISHHKIGQFNHCDEGTVLKRVRAKRMNGALATELLHVYSEQYQDTKSSEALFLWKGHHEGREYFLNPKKITEIRQLLIDHH